MARGITQNNNGKRKLNPANYNYRKSALKALWYCNHYSGKGLDFETFCKLIEEPCYYCGDVKTKTFNRALRDRQRGLAVSDAAIELGEIKYNGIDKINPDLGYVEGNIVTACFVCNLAKHLMSQDDFLNQVEKIHNHQANKPKEMSKNEEIIKEYFTDLLYADDTQTDNPIITFGGKVIGYGHPYPTEIDKSNPIVTAWGEVIGYGRDK